MTKYISAKELMKILDISAQRLAYWRKTDKIPFQKIANKVYIYEMPIFENKNTTSLCSCVQFETN